MSTPVLLVLFFLFTLSAVSAAGYMLELRYRVVDTERARPLFDPRARPYLVDEASGARMFVASPPMVGPLRTSRPPQAGRNYFILFANPARRVKAGDLVTLVIGEFRAEGLQVGSPALREG